MRATVAWIILLFLAPLCSRAQSADEQSPLIVEALQCEGNQFFSCRSILGYLYLGVGVGMGDRMNEEFWSGCRVSSAKA